MRLVIAALWMCLLATASLAQGNYLVRPGDTLQVEVLEDGNLNRSVIVLPDGRFSFPYAGTVQAGGRTLGQIERTLTAAIASNFAIEPNVFVSVANLRPREQQSAAVAPVLPTISVFFLGEVASPGEKNLTPGITLLQALAVSGGFSNFAAEKRIQLRRTDPSTGKQNVYTINYKALSRGAQANTIVLTDGDVILVPERRLFE
jgi:polysaccharide export outer membrane protein